MRVIVSSVQRDWPCAHIRRNVWLWINKECRYTGETVLDFIDQALLAELARREEAGIRAPGLEQWPH